MWSYKPTKCTHYLDPETGEFRCTLGYQLCQDHGKHTPCSFSTHKKGN